MGVNAFIDANVFIWAEERPNSNAAKIMGLIAEKKLDVVINQKILDEVFKYYITFYNKTKASDYRFLLLQSCNVIQQDQIEKELEEWSGKIKKKDLPHLAAVKAFHIPYLVSLDRDFKKFKEYYTPKQFIQLLRLKPAKTDY